MPDAPAIRRVDATPVGRTRGGAEGLAVVPALGHARALLAAVVGRDEAQVRALTRAWYVRWIPRAVREEARAIVRLPRGRERHPTQLLTFIRLLERLAEYDEAPAGLPES